jgi:hypothetical protein
MTSLHTPLNAPSLRAPSAAKAFQRGLLSAALVPLLALSQPTDVESQLRVSKSRSAACIKHMNGYVDTIRMLRDTAGADLADRVAAAFVSEQELLRVATAEGPCAAADLLRQKGIR